MGTEIQDIVAARRSAGLPADTAEMLKHLLAVQVSHRAFTPDPVPQNTIEEILGAAQLTASWCNSQPWQVTVTSGAGTDRLRDALGAAIRSGQVEAPDIAFPREYRGVYRDRRRESGFQLYTALGIERGDRDRQLEQTQLNFAFFGAPHVAIIGMDRRFSIYGALDADEKEDRLLRFVGGERRILLGKPSIFGFGINLQMVARMAFVGVNDSWESYYQSVRRIYRFGQSRACDVHLFASDAEGAVIDNLARKEADAKKMADELSAETRDSLQASVLRRFNRHNPYTPAKSIAVPAWLRSAHV